ncbi:MAG: coproporphyrinogen III oxidase [Alphaproteobacteria bacterium]|nr:coproporphyrinogen III oxidase [Alphaproteobacteria bacterium]
MKRSFPKSDTAARARTRVETLQSRLSDRLADLDARHGEGVRPEPVEWLRDDGRHGGGVRYQLGDTVAFDRASVNVSVVHYDDDPTKQLGSATAISTIVHPRFARAPSMHMHISWTEMRDGRGYWRMMADLNPSIPYDDDRAAFAKALRDAAPAAYDEAAAQGDRYFWIPALGRHRGVTHFYLEAWNTGDFDRDDALATTVGEATIDTYHRLVDQAYRTRVAEPGDAEAQLEYHTLYLFQVLTLDRGTTSGLLVHDQNDVGIMGSLPSHVDGTLLASWADRVPAPQGALVEALAAIVGPHRQPVTVEKKAALAQAVRTHYRAHPEALDLQAAGNVVPPTVANHRG